MLNNIPAELRALNQWVVADMSINPETGLPKKHPLNPRTGQMADISDPSTWGSFESVRGHPHFGFVFSKNDPYCVIDLDNKLHNPASPEEIERHHKILTAFDSYTERSVSGTGYHIIVKGTIPSGIHRDKVEVYSSGHYMITTGDVVRASPIAEYQALLDTLYGEMKPAEVSELVDHDEVLDDKDLVEMAMNAANGEKYIALCNGSALPEYPSQSEADFALLSMLAFYTQNNEQVRRLFRMSALGKRSKATKNDVYLNRALEKIRENQPGNVEMSTLMKKARAVTQGATFQNEPSVPTAIEGATNEQDDPTIDEAPAIGITLPPGLIGELAAYFYASAVRPVPEVALSAAIALMAGVAGRSYNIWGMGLNHYLILLAKTGTGKEGAVTGIERMVAALRPQIPMLDNYMGPSKFGSGQGLIRVLSERPCFVSVLGEFGLTLQMLTDARANSADKMTKQVLLDLYNKSGWFQTLRSTAYSDVEKNTKVVQAPNVTILGESTPEAFYDGLDLSHISDGLIPRFVVIEYKGHKPAFNKGAGFAPPPELLQHFSDMAVTALTITGNNTVCQVKQTPEAESMIDQFEVETTKIANERNNSGPIVEIWNRAHQNVLKLSSLVAVGVNPNAPLVDAAIAQWALNFVKASASNMAHRFVSGDIGQGDSKQMNDMERAVKSFFKLSNVQMEGYGLSTESVPLFRKHGAIPYIYLQKRIRNLASFKTDRLGALPAMSKILKAMVDSGLLLEISKGQGADKLKFGGLCYIVSGKW